MPERFTVRSKDGVEISVQKAGSGPALLLVHGSLLNGAISWGAMLPRLAERFTVYAMDRRGRALSGDAPQYSISNEADDIVAVVHSIGGPAAVLGHSYGARAALEALDRLESVSHLILYEPPITFETGDLGPLLTMERALEAGDREQILKIFLTAQVQMPEEGLAMMRSSPLWPVVLDISPTLPRESRTVNTRRLATGPLANWKTPSTILLGSETAGMLRDAAFFVQKNIPGCRMIILEGQGHRANIDAPDYLAAKIIEIVTAPSRSSSHTADCGPSMTSSVTSSPRRAGRQCRNTASGLASAISSASTR